MLPTVSTGSEEDGSESPAATPLVPVVAFVGWGFGVCWGSCVDFVHEAQAHATHSTNTVVLSVSHAFIDISDALPFDHAVSFERCVLTEPRERNRGDDCKALAEETFKRGSEIFSARRSRGGCVNPWLFLGGAIIPTFRDEATIR